MPDRKRFGNEGELRDFIKAELEKQGYEVDSEVRLEGVQVDLYAKKSNEYSVIEVKFRNIKGILDDISKCVRLSYSPDVDRTYVAAPAMVIPQEYIDAAESVGVGVLLVTDDGISKEKESSFRRQADLSLGWSHPDEVYVGEHFTIGIHVANRGPKIARNIELRYTPSGPFGRPMRTKNRRVIDELEPRASVEYPFRVKVKPNARAGKYPLFIRISAYRIAGRTHALELTVKKRPPEEKKRRTVSAKEMYAHLRENLLESRSKVEYEDILKFLRDQFEEK